MRSAGALLAFATVSHAVATDVVAPVTVCDTSGDTVACRERMLTEVPAFRSNARKMYREHGRRAWPADSARLVPPRGRPSRTTCGHPWDLCGPAICAARGRTPSPGAEAHVTGDAFFSGCVRPKTSSWPTQPRRSPAVAHRGTPARGWAPCRTCARSRAARVTAAAHRRQRGRAVAESRVPTKIDSAALNQPDSAESAQAVADIWRRNPQRARGSSSSAATARATQRRRVPRAHVSGRIPWGRYCPYALRPSLSSLSLSLSRPCCSLVLHQSVLPREASSA